MITLPPFDNEEDDENHAADSTDHTQSKGGEEADAKRNDDRAQHKKDKGDGADYCNRRFVLRRMKHDDLLTCKGVEQDG